MPGPLGQNPDQAFVLSRVEIPARPSALPSRFEQHDLLGVTSGPVSPSAWPRLGNCDSGLFAGDRAGTRSQVPETARTFVQQGCVRSRNAPPPRCSSGATSTPRVQGVDEVVTSPYSTLSVTSPSRAGTARTLHDRVRICAYPYCCRIPDRAGPRTIPTAGTASQQVVHAAHRGNLGELHSVQCGRKNGAKRSRRTPGVDVTPVDVLFDDGFESSLMRRP